MHLKSSVRVIAFSHGMLFALLDRRSVHGGAFADLLICSAGVFVVDADAVAFSHSLVPNSSIISYALLNVLLNVLKLSQTLALKNSLFFCLLLIWQF